MARKTRSHPLLYMVRSPRLSSFRTDLAPRALNLIPWAVSSHTKVSVAVARLQDNQLQTLLVFAGDNRLVGVLTASLEIAALGKKRKTNAEVLEACWRRCEAACADHGGCLWANVSYDKKGFVHCDGYACQDMSTGGATLDSALRLRRP